MSSNDVQLHRILHPVWTKEQVEHYREYGETAYGESFTDEQLDAELDAIKSGKPNPCGTDHGWYFHITYQGRLAGHIMLEPDSEDDEEIMGMRDETQEDNREVCELLVAVYDGFSRRGIAAEAIRQVTTKEDVIAQYRALDAIVRPSNLIADGVGRMLDKSGFSYRSESCEGHRLYRRRLHR